MKCPQCDFENEEGSKFCKNCNEPLVKFKIPNTIENPYIKIEEDQPFNIIPNEEDEEDKIRKKIEREEEIRAEVRAKRTKIEKEKENSSSVAGCLGFLVLVIIVYFIMFNPFASQKEGTQSSSITLNASVSFTGTQFVIENNDNFDWLNVKMEVNGALLKNGFIFEMNRIKAGEKYTVGALQFAKGDGTRFNPFTYKPKKFDISCDTLKGERAFYSGSWGGD